MLKTLGLRSKQHQYNDIPEMEVVKNDFTDPEMQLQAPPYMALASILNARVIKTSFTPPLDIAANRIIKRCVDIVFSIIVIITVLSWLIPIMAILIKLSSKGPVFFLQKRNKRNGEVFTCIKFRSMIVNADADILPAEKNDKRITRLGRFLRRNYIDELPQFFNVLWGDMSVVGPRPHMISDNIKYDKEVNGYFFRHKVKPGITGLAQVLGHVGVTENVQQMKDRVSMDIFYARHWSARIDIIILFRTVAKAPYLSA
jgi:putative colanic acid biosynthesis UDP-glucose lipid carrier transferase